jgi:hypothetical protein
VRERRQLRQHRLRQASSAERVPPRAQRSAGPRGQASAKVSSPVETPWERAVPTDVAASGGGAGRRRRRGEADAAGDAEHKNPCSVCPHLSEGWRRTTKRGRVKMWTPAWQ